MVGELKFGLVGGRGFVRWFAEDGCVGSCGAFGGRDMADELKIRTRSLGDGFERSGEDVAAPQVVWKWREADEDCPT